MASFPGKGRVLGNTKKRARNSSLFDLGDVLSPELLSQVYRFLDPLDKDGNEAIEYLTRNEKCADSPVHTLDFFSAFCSNLDESPSERGEQNITKARKSRGNRIRSRLLTGLHLLRVMNLEYLYETPQTVKKALVKLGINGYDVLFKRVLKKAHLVFGLRRVNCRSIFVKSAKARANPGRTEIARALLKYYYKHDVLDMQPYSKHCHPLCVAAAALNSEIVACPEMMRYVKDDEPIIDSLVYVLREAIFLARDESRMGSTVLELVRMLSLRFPASMSLLFDKMRFDMKYCEKSRHVAIAMAVLKIPLTEKILRGIGHHGCCLATFRALDELGALEGLKHPVHWIGEGGTKQLLPVANHTWKCAMTENSEEQIRHAILSSFVDASTKVPQNHLQRDWVKAMIDIEYLRQNNALLLEIIEEKKDLYHHYKWSEFFTLMVDLLVSGNE